MIEEALPFSGISNRGIVSIVQISKWFYWLVGVRLSVASCSKEKLFTTYLHSCHIESLILLALAERQAKFETDKSMKNQPQ